MSTTRVPKRLVFTHHKCASGWSAMLFRALAERLPLSMSIHNSFPQTRPDSDETRALVDAELRSGSAAQLVYDANARMFCLDALSGLGECLAVHIIRDPRDVLVSAYYSHRDVHSTAGWPELEEQRRRLQSMSVEDGLIDELDFVSFCLDAIAGWDYAHPRVMTVRYEELFDAQGPTNAVRRMLDWLWIDAPPQLVHTILDEIRFERLSGGRTNGEEDGRHHYRRGVAGDWRHHFTERVARAFDRRYGDCLRVAGYDTQLV